MRTALERDIDRKFIRWVDKQVEVKNLDTLRFALEAECARLAERLTRRRAELRGLKARAAKTTTPRYPPHEKGRAGACACPPTSPPPGAGDAPAPGAVES